MQVYLVGGAVRDELLGLPVHERDYVVVGATPQTMLELGYSQVGKDFPVFLHPQSKEEYALARTERKAGKGYTGFTCYAAPDVSLEDDLLRRDLTVNAIAKDTQGTLVDPFNGINDLENRLLRHVSPAFSEDPLRILRLARFAARFHNLGFKVAAETLNLTKDMVSAGELTELTRERVWQEISRSLQGPNPQVFCELLETLNAWPQLLRTRHYTPADWALLQVLRNESDIAVAFTAFTLVIAKTNETLSVHDIGEAFRAPNECTKVADIASSLADTLSEFSDRKSLAEALFPHLQKSDVARRPEQWSKAIDSLKLLTFISASEHSRLAQTARAYRAVEAAPLIANGLNGAELGEAIQQARIEAVVNAIQNAV